MRAGMNYHGKQPISGPVYCVRKQWDTEDKMNSATVKSATVKDVKWKRDMEYENEEDKIENKKQRSTS
eukprot:13508927-Ditylum_brightwellii.AAC.1